MKCLRCKKPIYQDSEGLWYVNSLNWYKYGCSSTGVRPEWHEPDWIGLYLEQI